MVVLAGTLGWKGGSVVSADCYGPDMVEVENVAVHCGTEFWVEGHSSEYPGSDAAGRSSLQELNLNIEAHLSIITQKAWGEGGVKQVPETKAPNLI